MFHQLGVLFAGTDIYFECLFAVSPAHFWSQASYGSEMLTPGSVVKEVEAVNLADFRNKIADMHALSLTKYTPFYW